MEPIEKLEVSEPVHVGMPKPIVVKTKKKKKYKYSRGLKDLQVSGRKVNKASSRLVKAVAKGMTEYRKASDKSARKKRDGAIRDFGLNVAKGMGKGLRPSSGIAWIWRAICSASLKYACALSRSFISFDT